MGGLLRVPFFDDEVLTSYLSRTAKANGSAGLKQFCLHMGLSYRGVAAGEKNATDKTADLLGDLRETFEGRRISMAGVRHVEFRGELFTNTQMRRVPAHICWHCLIEDEAHDERLPGTRRYARIAWAFQCLPVCVRHERALTAVPTPDRKLSFDFYGLLDAVRPPVNSQTGPTVATDFAIYVASRLGVKARPPCLLDDTEIPACIAACENIGKAALFGRVYQDRRMGPVAMRLIFSRGFEVFNNGPESVQTLLNSLCRDVDNGHATSGKAIYGTLYQALARRPESRAFLASLVLKHAVERYPHLHLQSVFPELTGRVH